MNSGSELKKSSEYLVVYDLYFLNSYFFNIQADVVYLDPINDKLPKWVTKWHINEQKLRVRVCVKLWVGVKFILASCKCVNEPRSSMQFF